MCLPPASVAELKAEATRIEMEAELECQSNARGAEINFLREQNDLEVTRARELCGIEVRDDEMDVCRCIMYMYVYVLAI